MLRRQLVALLGAVGGFAMTQKAEAQELAASGAALASADIEAIRALISTYEHVWNASDLDAMGRLYAPNVHWVNVKGMHWRGFDEVDRAHRIYFDIMFRGVQQKVLEIESITSITPTVAVTVVHLHMDEFRTPSGEIAPPHESRMSLVLAKLASEWKIAHGANIDVDSHAAQHDPIRGNPARPMPS
jgi:uncharacterized protein (TIGR02246 family)